MAVMDYRTQDGRANYGFSIEFQPETGWRIYIVFRPLYQGSGGNPKWLCQATDDDGRSYVDWPAKLDSLGDAKTVAALWAENIERHARELVQSGDEARKTQNPRSTSRRNPEAA